MSGTAQGAQSGPRDRMVFALILIVVGLGGLASQLLETNADVGGWVVLIIGLVFMGAFVYSHQYGFLVPGGIMTGLGAGIVVQQSLTLTDEQSAAAVVLGLGLGFASIWVIGTLAKAAGNHPWPLVPGVILTIVGGGLAIGGQAVDLLNYWGIGVIALGVILLWRAWTESQRQA
jgi:hypothetical protein